MQRPFACHKLNTVVFFSGTIIGKFNAYFMWWIYVKEFVYISCPFGSKNKESLAQENALLPKSPLNLFYGWVSMSCAQHEEFENIESETEENLKQLSATNISEQAKGKEKHFYYQKVFSHLWMHSHIRKLFSESKFPHQAINLSLIFSNRKMVQYKVENISILVALFWQRLS